MPEAISLKWSAQFSVTPPSPSSRSLPGDKILLPASALEQLLSAATVNVPAQDQQQSYTPEFDPYNPHSYAAERRARAQFRDQQQQLPHPLTFRLVNPQNGRVVYAGIREFSAEESEIGLSTFLRQSLGLEENKAVLDSKLAQSNGVDTENPGGHVVYDLTGDDETLPRITVHAKQLPKGTYVRLRPLEAGYDPEDWKSLLEQHLRANFTTLTNGEILLVPSGRVTGGKKDEFRFLIDGFKPEGDGICVVDTDLEVDIEALNEEQARETLKRHIAKSQRAPGTREGSSVGGKLELWEGQQGQVQEGEYVDYEIPSWDRSQGLEIEISGVDDEEEVDLFVSPFSSRQRAKPRDDEHVFGDFSSQYPKRIRIQPTNIELENAEAIWISVHGYQHPTDAEDDSTSSKTPPRTYYIRATPFDPTSASTESTSPTLDEEAPSPDEVRCKNCHQLVPQRTMMLHENFCLRNNILCPHCHLVFKKSSPEWTNHWHCPHDSNFGNTSTSQSKHALVSHSAHTCPSCPQHAVFSSLSLLAQHRTTTCPSKLHLCQFCHLEVPVTDDPLSSPPPESILSNLTPHELADGARTTECHLCGARVRLRDMHTHLLHHSLERLSRPSPRICRNVNCGRTLDGVGKNGDVRAGARIGQGPGNDLGLCSICFGPLYVSMYDPEGRALKRRIERRYLAQMMSGCGKPWCSNAFCKSGRKNVGIVPDGSGGGGDGSEGAAVAMSAKDVLPLIKPAVDAWRDLSSPLHFCVDEASQRRRGLAEMLAAEKSDAHPEMHLKGGAAAGASGGYALEWCVAALEAEGGDLDRAQTWLKNWAPTRQEAAGR
ncbi:MAG: hypothetical protein M1819_003818 [Sarea resinae]|nr:MAG: hypothetical protein M1819_003818 [Sarea resinae]